MENMKDPFKSDKPLYDYSIKYDVTKLPWELQDYIKELEEYDKDGDWFNYDIKFDEFEVVVKGYRRHNIISDYDYKTLLAKYGWLYD